MRQVLEAREGNGSEGKPVRRVPQRPKTRASQDCKARSSSTKQSAINSTCIWSKHYSEANNSLVNGENREQCQTPEVRCKLWTRKTKLCLQREALACSVGRLGLTLLWTVRGPQRTHLVDREPCCELPNTHGTAARKPHL